MIAKLQGEVQDIFENFIILMVNGIGYRVEGIFTKYMEGDKIVLYIFHHIREQEERLFGFEKIEEYKLFQLLISVSGVGPKAGMSMINNLGVNTIVSGIRRDDPAILKAPGVGKKTAERVLVDMKSKIKILDGLSSVTADQDDDRIQSDTIVSEAVEGLISLGFIRGDIEKSLEYIDFKEYNDTSSIIKKVLSLLKKK